MSDRDQQRRPWAGVAAGAVTLAVVAVPAFWTGFFALASFTGCSLECHEPEVGVGLLWAAVTALLLALPIAVGLVVSGARRSRG